MSRWLWSGSDSTIEGVTATELSLVFDRLSLPDTEIARDAYAFTMRAVPSFVLNHSARSYVFARAHAARRGLRPGPDYDDELLFLSCVLHDIGLSDEGNGHHRFEVDGADTAATFLREHGVEDRRVEIAWDAIALHTSQGIAERKAVEVALSQAGIGTDILGADRDTLPPGLADEVHALLPRENLAYALTDVILTQAIADPRKAVPVTFPGELLRHHLPHGAFPGWYELIANAGWGDQPLDTTGRRRAETPEQLAGLFVDYLDAGDLDGLVSLYEPNAHLVATPGAPAAGHDAIRSALRQMIAGGARLKLDPHGIHVVDDIALVSNTATLTGAEPEPIVTTTTEILRRQPDGSWRYVLDDPFHT